MTIQILFKFYLNLLELQLREFAAKMYRVPGSLNNLQVGVDLTFFSNPFLRRTPNTPFRLVIIILIIIINVVSTLNELKPRILLIQISQQA